MPAAYSPSKQQKFSSLTGSSANYQRGIGTTTTTAKFLNNIPNSNNNNNNNNVNLSNSLAILNNNSFKNEENTSMLFYDNQQDVLYNDQINRIVPIRQTQQKYPQNSINSKNNNSNNKIYTDSLHYSTSNSTNCYSNNSIQRRSSYGAGVHNYMSILDYSSSSTITTTKITSPLLCDSRRYYNLANNVSLIDDTSSTYLTKQPLLLVVENYNHETTKKTTTTTAPLTDTELAKNKPTNVDDYLPLNIEKSAIHQQNLNLNDNHDDEPRETWTRKIDFLLSVIGFAVDLANVWRFPYLCFKNGGGAFLIPYTIMVLFAGIPLFYMELALGQYFRKGAITTWGRICPLFKGIGYCVIMTAFYTDFFYNVIIAFALHYFYASFTTKLPWSSCSNSYNSPACYEPYWSENANGEKCANKPLTLKIKNSSGYVIESNLRPISAAEEYFYKYLLGLHEPGQPDAHVKQSLNNLGSINWEIVLCVFIVYIICYFSLWKGIKMSGKVVWFTAIFPYIVLGILLIRGITLPGAEKGIEYYLRPNIEMLKVPGVWQDAATQVFFSLGPGFGVLMAYSSYNEFHNNVYFDALITSTINCCTSFLSGFVIFSVLGYMSCKSGKPIDEVAQEGPGLVFVVYPEALATMPGASIWSIIFFLMLLTLGLDSSFGGSEAIITGLSDEYPIIKRNREIFVACLFILYMAIGMFMCTQGGMLIMEWLIVYGTTWGLLIAVLCEVMVISFIYGINHFIDNIREMMGFTPGWYWRICWTIGAPIFLIVMIMSSFINYQPLKYQDYVYSYNANVFGVIFALTSASAIPIVALYTLYHQDADKFLDKFRLAITPYNLQNRLQHRRSLIIESDNHSGNLHLSDIML